VFAVVVLLPPFNILASIPTLVLGGNGDGDGDVGESDVYANDGEGSNGDDTAMDVGLDLDVGADVVVDVDAVEEEIVVGGCVAEFTAVFVCDLESNFVVVGVDCETPLN
jgi:hypothetical protein